MRKSLSVKDSLAQQSDKLEVRFTEINILL